MVLSSQMPQGGGGFRRSRASRRRAALKPWLGVLAVLLIAAGGGYYFWQYSGGVAQDDAATAAAAQRAAAAADSATPGGGSPAEAADGAAAATSGATAGGADSLPAPTGGGAQGAAAAQGERAEVLRQERPSPAQLQQKFQAGMRLIEDGRIIEGRQMLSDLLLRSGDELAQRDAQAIRDTVGSINRKALFSPQMLPGDPYVFTHVVQGNEYLLHIAGRNRVSYQLLEQINNTDARRIYAGRKLKVIRGPFHVVVDKSAYRLDVILEPAAVAAAAGDKPAATQPAATQGNPAVSTLSLDSPAPTAAGPLYVCSFPISVGKGDSTPAGNFRVAREGKLANPSWTNPRTGEFFGADDPKNPIGEYWIGLEGLDGDTRELRGYGIHGTIDPESIGQQASMGCIRLRDGDIAQVFKLLAANASRVTIYP